MTERRRRPTCDKWPFHDEIFIESHDSETLNFFHLHRRLFLLLSGFFLGLRPIMPRAVHRHLQHLPELSLLSAETNPAQAQLSLGSLRQFKAYISCFFLLLFSLAATVNIYFQCINILKTCCWPVDSYGLFSLIIGGI